MSEIKPTEQIGKPESNNITGSFIDPSTNNFSRKRKASEMDRPMPTISNEENFRASEEELRGRRIVRVVRNNEGEAKPTEVIKGKFTFNQETKANELETPYKLKAPVTEKKEEGGVNPSAKKNETLLKEQKNEAVISNSSEVFNFRANPFARNEESNTTNNNITATNIPSINNITTNTTNNLQNKICNNPFLKSESVVTVTSVASVAPVKDNILTNPFTNKPSTANNVNNINSNPFANVSGNTSNNPFTRNETSHNPFIKTEIGTNPFTKHANSNPFAMSANTTFNFNLNQATSNPNWNSDDEEEGNGEDNNPEEEVGIRGEVNTKPAEEVVVKSNSPKLIKIQLEELAVYDFEAKKYHSKGKGELSIEVKKAQNDKVIALIVYRNSAMVPIFTAQIVKDISTYESLVKNYKHYGMVQKLTSRNETTGKNENKSVKITFSSENDSKTLNEKFKQAMKILVDNDLSLVG